MREREKERDPSASKPFNRAEIRELLKVADGMSWKGRHILEPDPRFMGRLLRVFLTFGPHPSKVGRWTSRDNLIVRPTERGNRVYLTWTRAKKKQTTRPNIEIEVPESYLPWLAEWLDQPKPKSEWAYWTFFQEIEHRLRETTEYRFHVNPLRARHTCAQQMMERGFSSIDVEATIGVAPSTLRTYAQSTSEQRGAKAEQLGWGSWE
jgi:integrase